MTLEHRRSCWGRSLGRAALVLGFSLAGCGASGEDKAAALSTLNSALEDGRTCGEGDVCVLAGRGNCSCDTPVRESAKPAIDAAVREVNDVCGAGEFRAICNLWTNARCESSRCVADKR